MPLPPIERIDTPRLALVPVAEQHLDDLLQVNGDAQVTRFLPYASWAARHDAQAWLARMDTLAQSGTAQQLVLQRQADGQAVGTLLLFKWDEGSHRLELGYALGSAHWGQGLMREAVEAVCAHAFQAQGVRRIEAEVNPANAPSWRLLEAVGFTHEGTLRQRWTAKGASHDTRVYGLLAQDRALPSPEA